MRPDAPAERRLQVADGLFAAFLVGFAIISSRLIPYDFTDLCYLFSLEQGRWVTQEWVHPIWVPLLAVLQNALHAFGYHGPMLAPVEYFNIALVMVAFALLYRIARRFPGSALAAAVALGVTAFCQGFWSAAVRPTPYAATLLSQTVALSLLISDRPVAPRRYAMAGVWAGLAMGFHAAAMALAPAAVVCALCEPDPARTTRSTWLRISAFGAAMLGTAIVCWAIFVVYRDIGPSYFRSQDFHATFAAIEQVPGTSIYSSGSVITQLVTFGETIRRQAGAVPYIAVIGALVALLRYWQRRASVTPAERRLAIAAGANFAAVAGFFIINNTHNGLIFISLTLIPVLAAVAMRSSWIGVVALAFLTVPDTAREVRYSVMNNMNGANDPLLVEVRFLQSTLGPRDVLLTPGTPFPEMFYLSHLNIIEVSPDVSTHPGSEVPLARPGAALRARVAWWVGQGSRVFYALGDESTDFKGDFGGAEKGRQIFWRPETDASERAPKLRAVRAALEASDLELRSGPTSPNGERYAEIHLRESQAPLAARPSAGVPLAPEELRSALLDGNPEDAASPFPRRAQFLAQYAAAVPGDPWLACDVMALVCNGHPRRDGGTVRCQSMTGCDPMPQPSRADDGGGHDVIDGCFWAPLSDQAAVARYLAAWAQQQGLGELSDWGFSADRSQAEILMEFPRGKVQLSWLLLSSCSAGPVEIQRSGGLADTAFGADQVHEFVERLPVPKVRSAGG